MVGKLWFREEAKDWNEALPVGNGFMGAMIFGDPVSERIQINEDSVWSGGPMDRINPDAKENLEQIRTLLEDGYIQKAEELAEQSMYGTYPHMRHYQTLGDVWIQFGDMQGEGSLEVSDDHTHKLKYKAKAIENYERSLNLENAVGSMSYRRNGSSHSREFYASNPAKVIVYHMKAGTGQKLNFEVSATRKDNRGGRGASFCDGAYVLESNTICLHGWQGGADGIGFELTVRVEATGGKRYRMGSHIVVEDAKEAILYMTGRTTFRSENPHTWCVETLNRASAKNIELLKQEHIRDYQKHFQSSNLKLKSDESLNQYSTPERLERMRSGREDVGLANIYYDYARYLLISSSREGSLPSNLQGIWNQEFEPAWGSKYTININIEMNYWLAEKTGLSDLHMPLISHLKQMHKCGKQVAKQMYGASGFCCHHNTDIWGDCAPQDNHTSATIWPMGGAWLCLHLIEHYRYTRDIQFLQEYYEILKDCVLFYVDYMVQDKRGYWVTGPSSSPENIYLNKKKEYGCLCMGPTMDMQILTELFGGFMDVSYDLGIADDITEEAQKRFLGMPPLKIGKYGQVQEWQEDYEELDRGHRHVSQLFALYPGSQIRVDKTPDLAVAAEKTLERRLENGGGHTGWSKAWMILFYARLHRGEQSWKHLKELLKDATMNNLLDNHPPFQIDGNFGGAAGILEMLIQDFEEKIYLIPALPHELNEGEVTGIHTKGGCKLSFCWKSFKVKELTLLGLRDGEIEFVIEDKKSIRVSYKKNEEKSIRFE